MLQLIDNALANMRHITRYEHWNGTIARVPKCDTLCKVVVHELLDAVLKMLQSRQESWWDIEGLPDLRTSMRERRVSV